MSEVSGELAFAALLICGAVFAVFAVGEPPAFHAWLAHRRESARLDAETRIRLEEIKLRMLEGPKP